MTISFVFLDKELRLRFLPSRALLFRDFYLDELAYFSGDEVYRPRDVYVTAEVCATFVKFRVGN